MFKTILSVIFLAALSVAHPGHGQGLPAAAQGQLVNRDDGSNSTDNLTAIVSNEVLPNFVLPCKCPEPFCDSRMSAHSICLCKEAAKLACYLASTQAGANTAAGCPMPPDDACVGV